MHFFEVDIASLQFATPSLSVLILTFDFFVLFYTQNTPEYTHPPLPTLPTILVETWEPFNYGFHSTRVMSKRFFDIYCAFFFFFFLHKAAGFELKRHQGARAWAQFFERWITLSTG